MPYGVVFELIRNDKMRKFDNGYFESGILWQFLTTVIPQAVMVFEVIAAAVFLGFGRGWVRFIGLVPATLFILQRFYRFGRMSKINDLIKNNGDLSLCTSQKALSYIRTAYHRAVFSDIDFELDLADRALSDRETQLMFYRLGIDPLEVEEKILARLNDEVIGIKEDVFSNILALSECAAKTALRTGGKKIESADFLIASVILRHDELARIVKAFRITAEEMQEALLMERSRGRKLRRNFINNFKKYVYRLIGRKFEIQEIMPGEVKFFSDELVFSALSALGKGEPIFLLEHYKTESLEFVEQMADQISRQNYFLGHKIIFGENILRREKIGKFSRETDVYYFKNLDLLKDPALVALVTSAIRDGAGVVIALMPNEINRAEKMFPKAPVIRLPKMKDEDLEIILAQRAAFMEEGELRMAVSSIKEIMRVMKRYFPGSFLSGEQIIREAISQAARGGNKLVLDNDILKATEKLYQEELPMRLSALRKEAVEKLFETGMTRGVSEAAAFYLLQYRAKLWHEAMPISFFVVSDDRGYCERIRGICLESALGVNWTRDRVIEIDALQYKNPHTLESLIGSEDQKVYGKLTEFAVENPRAVIVIENFSQSSAEFKKMIYQVIKDGRIKDGKGKLVDATGLLLLIFDCGVLADNGAVDYQKFLITIVNKK